MRTHRVLTGLGAIAVLGTAAQLLPYGRDHENPPVLQEPVWDSPDLRRLAVRACYDCHSHETRWPWYSRIAPVSWLVAHDVSEGRKALNFSDWGARSEAQEEAAEEVLEGEMPPLAYRALHPDARLSPEQTRRLADGLAALARASASASEPAEP
jgi:hypothetical protein